VTENQAHGKDNGAEWSVLREKSIGDWVAFWAGEVISDE